MLKRNFPPAIAAFTWLFQISNLYKVKSDKLITIRYEDLIENPWEIASQVIKTISFKYVDPELIKKSYEDNIFRKASTHRIPSWTSPTYGSIVNANKNTIRRQTSLLLKKSLNYKISDTWTKLYSIPPISFPEAISKFKYEAEIMYNTSNISNVNTNIFTIKDRLFLLRRNIVQNYRCDSFYPLFSSPIQKI